MTSPSHLFEDEKKFAELNPDDEYLGWEGHVHMPDGPPLWTRILRNWPELRTGLAFSLVFAAGTIIGCSLGTFWNCKRQKSTKY
ncbi:MAG: hypothetical protein GKS05_07960 [Nitrospirales bacterium]|nr:hypothetical protein [Nitrospirales bacterium]